MKWLEKRGLLGITGTIIKGKLRIIRLMGRESCTKMECNSRDTLQTITYKGKVSKFLLIINLKEIIIEERELMDVLFGISINLNLQFMRGVSLMNSLMEKES